MKQDECLASPNACQHTCYNYLDTRLLLGEGVARKTEDCGRTESPPGPSGGLISLQIKRVCSLEREIVLGSLL